MIIRIYIHTYVYIFIGFHIEAYESWTREALVGPRRQSYSLFVVCSWFVRTHLLELANLCRLGLDRRLNIIFALGVE